MSSGCFSQVKQGLNKIIHGEDFIYHLNFKHDTFYFGFAEARNNIWSIQNMTYFTIFTEKEIIKVTAAYLQREHLHRGPEDCRRNEQSDRWLGANGADHHQDHLCPRHRLDQNN